MRRAALVLLFSVAPAASHGQAAEPLSLEQYRSELVGIANSLESGGSESARDRAAALLDRQVESGTGTFFTDATLLAPLAREDRSLPPAVRARALRRVADQLSPGIAAPAPADPGLLNRLTARQKQQALQRGGRVERGSGKPLTLSARAERALNAVGEGLSSAFDWVRDLLRKLWPRRRRGGATGMDVSSATTVLVALATAGLMLRARRASRGWRAEPAPLVSEAASSAARDDDPLSREASEWERYAAELRAKGRLREALRAHYHAVLVALFRAGLLSHQKGRTNWEYVAQLSPELRFRSSFIEITRRFDSEWYGRHPTTTDALVEYAGVASGILRALRASSAAA